MTYVESGIGWLNAPVALFHNKEQILVPSVFIQQPQAGLDVGNLEAHIPLYRAAAVYWACKQIGDHATPGAQSVGAIADVLRADEVEVGGNDHVWVARSRDVRDGHAHNNLAIARRRRGVIHVLSFEKGPGMGIEVEHDDLQSVRR
jgi:hypothetical protein